MPGELTDLVAFFAVVQAYFGVGPGAEKPRLLAMLDDLEDRPGSAAHGTNLLGTLVACQVPGTHLLVIAHRVASAAIGLHDHPEDRILVFGEGGDRLFGFKIPHLGGFVAAGTAQTIVVWEKCN